MSKHLSTSVRVPIEADNPSIVRNESLCIKCGQCRNVCTSPVGVLGTYALEQTGVGGNLATDALIAAQAMEAGGRVFTNDRDFARFPGLVTENPL